MLTYQSIWRRLWQERHLINYQRIREIIAMLGGYPTIMELLIDEQKSGRLHIKPVIIMTGGEYLSNQLCEKLSEAFECYVQTNYSCTEGGTIACECIQQHFHINDDWVVSIMWRFFYLLRSQSSILKAVSLNI